jgi:CheY-like chemotaxis protein
MIEQEKPELVLSHMSMREMTGYELAREIRRRTALIKQNSVSAKSTEIEHDPIAFTPCRHTMLVLEELQCIWSPPLQRDCRMTR